MIQYEVVMFHADWCQPCQQFKPVFNRAATELAKNDITFSYINIDSYQGKIQKERYGIKTIPTFVVEKNGELMAMQVGRTGESSFKDWVKRYTLDETS